MLLSRACCCTCLVRARDTLLLFTIKYFLAGLEDKGKKSKAERITFDLLEYLDQINYNKYYESMGAVGTRGGEKEKLFSDFSSQSIKAAQVEVPSPALKQLWHLAHKSKVFLRSNGAPAVVQIATCSDTAGQAKAVFRAHASR